MKETVNGKNSQQISIVVSKDDQSSKKEDKLSQEPSKSIRSTAVIDDTESEVAQNLPFYIRLIQRLQIKPMPQDTRWVLYLGYISLIIHTCNFFVASLAIAWTCYFTNPAIYALSYLGDTILMLNLVVQCFVEYDDEYGVTITDTNLIAKHFLFDQKGLLFLLATFPLDSVALAIAHARNETCFITHRERFLALGDSVLWDTYKYWALIRTLRFIPMVILGKKFFNLRIPGIAHPVTRLMKNLIVVILCAHMSACIFWLLSSSLNSANSWVHYNSLVTQNGERVPFSKQYLASLYAAENALFFIKRNVYLDEEEAFQIFETIIAAVIYGSLFGNLASIIKYLDSSESAQKAQREQKYRIQNIRKYMIEKNFPNEIQDKVLSHNQFLFMHNQGMDESRAFDNLPKLLQLEIANFLYLDLVKSVPLFKDLDTSFLNALVLQVKPMTVMSGWYIFRKDDEASEMYFIRSGSVEVCSADGKIVFVTLKKGGFFGEIALIEHGKRTASVRAAEPTELCFLTKTAFEELLENNPGVREKIMQVVAERKQQDAKRKAEQEAKKKAEEEAKKKAEEEAQRKAEEEARRSNDSSQSSHGLVRRREGDSSSGERDKRMSPYANRISTMIFQKAEPKKPNP